LAKDKHRILHSFRAHRAINAYRHAGGASDVKFTNVRRGANRLDPHCIQAAACQNLDFRTGYLFVSRQAFNLLCSYQKLHPGLFCLHLARWPAMLFPCPTDSISEIFIDKAIPSIRPLR